MNDTFFCSIHKKTRCIVLLYIRFWSMKHNDLRAKIRPDQKLIHYFPIMTIFHAFDLTLENHSFSFYDISFSCFEKYDFLFYIKPTATYFFSFCFIVSDHCLYRSNKRLKIILNLFRWYKNGYSSLYKTVFSLCTFLICFVKWTYSESKTIIICTRRKRTNIFLFLHHDS